ncbi:hypothetical protein Golax_000236 [Gossypium laxum]|uniref:Uncharacterized protein n=1 Tax=Gossypium laxum TaxID=34288 RepID=A0A7J9AUZ9_9ROSI|nr:hypothetical protein [Gossypium laxum]
MRFWIRRFVSDQALAMAFSNILIFKQSQAIALSTCIVAHNNALFALLVSNNFAEIKSNVFKRFSKDNIHNLAYAVTRCQHFQTLNMQTEDSKKNLTFVPLAPACVVRTG